MSEIRLVSKELLKADYIEKVEDKSSPIMSRLRIYFKNGHELSIIRGEHSYGGEEGLFEIMPDDESFFDDDDDGDVVLGYLTHDRVSYYIEKIGSMHAGEKNE